MSSSRRSSSPGSDDDEGSKGKHWSKHSRSKGSTSDRHGNRNTTDRRHSSKSHKHKKSDRRRRSRSKSVEYIDSIASSKTSTLLSEIESTRQKMRESLNTATSLSSNLPRSGTTGSKLAAIQQLQPKTEDVAAIDSEGFEQQSFQSSRGSRTAKAGTEDSVPYVSPADPHMAAIFGGAGQPMPIIASKKIGTASSTSTPKLEVPASVRRAEALTYMHESLFEDPDIRWARWIARMNELREQQLRGGDIKSFA